MNKKNSTKTYHQDPAINARFKAIRIALGKKQAEMADLLGYSGSLYSSLEQAGKEIGEHIIISTCAVFNVNRAYLLHGEEPMFLTLNEQQKKMVTSFTQLVPPLRKMMSDYLDMLLEFQVNNSIEEKHADE